MRIGFIGLGNMATAMVGGIIGKGLCAKEDIIGCDKLQVAADKAKEKFGICTVADNKSVVQQADVIVFAVKPIFLQEVIEEIKDVMTADKLIISIVAGKTISWIEQQFGSQIKLVRCMPNTPALVGEGCTGVSPNRLVAKADEETAMSILGSFGKAYMVEERLMDAVIGASGSSPASVFMFIEAMADAVVQAGMPRKQAYEFCAQAVLGSAKMVLETGMHPGELKDMVCSPSGTTIEAVKVLEERGFRGTVMAAVEASVEKSKHL